MSSKLTLNAGFDSNVSQEQSPGEKRFAFLEVDASLPVFPQGLVSPGLHVFSSATGGTGKTKWAKDRFSAYSIIHFDEPDAISDAATNQVYCRNLNQVCSAIESAWEQGKVPFVNSFSPIQLAEFRGYGTAEGGISLGFTVMLSQLSAELHFGGVPLIVVVNSRRESDNDDKYLRALTDIESSCTSLWWFKNGGSVYYKSRMDDVIMDGISFKYNRSSWIRVDWNGGSKKNKDGANEIVPTSESIIKTWGK